MASAILISENSGFSISGVEFDYLVESIRKILTIKNRTLLNNIFQPLDEGGMDFISIESLSKTEFNEFHEAVILAYKGQIENSLNIKLHTTWKELLSKLEMDNRYRNSI